MSPVCPTLLVGIVARQYGRTFGLSAPAGRVRAQSAPSSRCRGQRPGLREIGVLFSCCILLVHVPFVRRMWVWLGWGRNGDAKIHIFSDTAKKMFRLPDRYAGNRVFYVNFSYQSRVLYCTGSAYQRYFNDISTIFRRF